MALSGFQTSYNAAPGIGFPGMREGSGLGEDVLVMKNAEASANIPCGVAVCWVTSGATSDIDAKLPAATTDLVAGIVIHSHSYMPSWTDSNGTRFGELTATGLVPGTFMNVLRKGKIMVQVPASLTVKPSDRLWVRAIANGAISTQLGSCENANDGSNMIDCTKQGQFLTTPISQLTWLDVNFQSKP